MVCASLRMQRTPGEFVVGPGAHVQLLHGAEQAPASFVKLAVLVYLAGAHFPLLRSDEVSLSALARWPLWPSKRWRWRSQAASTRAWIVPVLAEQVRGLAQAVVR